MELIRNLGMRLNKNGRKQNWGVFQCPFCFKEVERRLQKGKKAKSCGCQKSKFISEFQKGKKLSIEYRQKISNSLKGRFLAEENPNYGNGYKIKGKNNPMFGKKGDEHPAFGYKHTEETRQDLSIKKVGKNNPMYGKKGELSPTWINGSSFKKYSQEFFDIRKQIFERDNYECQCPDCEHKTDLLDIHHIDYDKINNIPENLVTLCRSCHAKTFCKNSKNYYKIFYTNIIEDKKC